MNPKNNEPAKLKLNTETVRNLTQAEGTEKEVGKTVTYPYCCWTF